MIRVDMMPFIKAKVNTLLKKYGTCCPYSIADNLSVHVHKMPLHDEINGFYKYDRRNKYIIINSNLSDDKQFFTMCHELGHAVLHPKINTHFFRKHTLYSVDKIEKEANLFAIELLSHQERDQPITINEAVATYKIPKQLLIKNFYANKEQMFH